MKGPVSRPLTSHIPVDPASRHIVRPVEESVPMVEAKRMRLRLIAAEITVFAALGHAGCSIIAPRPISENPLVVPSADFETVWKATIAVLDEYFDIATESRLSRTIITQPRIGATVLEPWSGDSPGLYDRLESSLQTIRRHGRITINP